jgi:hypothetical protein
MAGTMPHSKIRRRLAVRALGDLFKMGDDLT